MKAAPRLVEKGFRQMKTQLALPGDTSPGREVERIRRVRESISPDIDLMCDINQRWSVYQAIDIGRHIEDVHLYWIEDVTAHDDYQGLARITAARTAGRPGAAASLLARPGFALERSCAVAGVASRAGQGHNGIPR